MRLPQALQPVRNMPRKKQLMQKLAQLKLLPENHLQIGRKNFSDLLQLRAQK
jgi:hypothetical protein